MLFFKGVSSLLSVCLACNVDSLEDDDAGSDNVPIDSESELLSDRIDSPYSTARSRSFP